MYTHSFLTFRSQPSGDCLYCSLVKLLYGNNSYMDELSVLSLIELFISN